MRNTKKGFTLVELLVVIAILAILATVSVVGYTNYINNANNSKAQQELTQLRDYAMAYDLSHDGTGAKDGKVNPTEAQKAIDDCDIEGVELVGNNVTYTVNGKVIAYWDITTGTVTLGAPTAGGEEGGETPVEPEPTPDPDPEPETPAEPTTVTVSISDYADSKSWADATQYTSLVMDENITVTVSGGGNTGKYYQNGENWRIYQNETPSIVVTAANNKTIKSVKITYASNTTGVLTQGSTQIPTGTVVNVDGSSVTFGVGNTTDGVTKGQVRITSIEVTYQ